jgi:GNAT superfamily N-acetyltransferase
MALTLRAATPADVPALEQLIAESARGLGRGHYSIAETEAAITHVFGVDTELVADGTYLVAQSGDRIAGCGGWSQRTTLFGGDRYQARESGRLDPATDAARIRAFFVHPDFARQGVADALLAACADAAAAAGFRRLALMATLPGLPFYRARGFVAGEATVLDLGNVPVTFVPMEKPLLPAIDPVPTNFA